MSSRTTGGTRDIWWRHYDGIVYHLAFSSFDEVFSYVESINISPSKNID